RRALGGTAVRPHGMAALCLLSALGLIAATAQLELMHAAGAANAPSSDRRLCRDYSGLPAAGLNRLTGPAPTDMAWIPVGTFVMGSDDAYREERPARRVTVDGFWIDRHEVTNAQFALFVAQTGYK